MSNTFKRRHNTTTLMNKFRFINRLIYFLFFYIISIVCFAQTNLILEETFDKNGVWPIEDKPNYNTDIKDGCYYITHKVPATGVAYSTPIDFDPALDFEIEAKITLVNGVIDNGFGLYTIDNSFTKFDLEHYFTISGNGYFKVYSYDKDNNSIAHQNWKTTEFVNQNYQTNILTIKKTGTNTFFYVNGSEVYNLTNFSFWGTKVGFIVYDNETIKIDYLTIKQDKRKINNVENTTVLKKENLGPNVNSILEDLTPVISHDGKTIYFSVRIADKSDLKLYNGDAWYSTLNADNTWTPKKNMGVPINNDAANYVVSATPDNNSLILVGYYNKDGTTRSDGFSITHREKDGWSIPEDMVVEDHYNDNDFSSFCLSPDRKVFLLAVERRDSYGQRDIYVSFIKDDNTWTAPKNLGPIINSYATEGTPFIAADGKTLYYSSFGKPGYGSSDVFMSRRTDDSWMHWTEPVNLGPQINTSDYEASYSIEASGEYAYLVSNKNSLGLGDIFRIKVSESAKPEPVVIIHGKVLDKLTKQPLAATIDYHELSTGADAGSARSNPTDGSYKIILPYGKAYGFLAEKTNFLAESDNIDLTTIKEYKEIERDLYLSPIEVGKSIALNNVFFVRSKAELLPDSYSELDRLVKLLTDNSNLKIEISGHTDNVGDPALNIKLSEDRVNTIKGYLISKNISAKRLSGKGYGGSKPIASNATEETRKLNRRVEFSIVGK